MIEIIASHDQEVYRCAMCGKKYDLQRQAQECARVGRKEYVAWRAVVRLQEMRNVVVVKLCGIQGAIMPVDECRFQEDQKCGDGLKLYFGSQRFDTGGLLVPGGDIGTGLVLCFTAEQICGCDEIRVADLEYAVRHGWYCKRGDWYDFEGLLFRTDLVMFYNSFFVSEGVLDEGKIIDKSWSPD